MKKLKSLIIFSFIALLAFGFAPDKDDFFQKEAPFTIIEKSYFYYVSGKKATNGFKIQLVGTYDSRNLNFSAIYFHNRELKVVPNVHLDKFTLVGGYTTLVSKDILVDEIALNDEVAKESSGDDIPFELEDDEAVIVYQINGRYHYYKVSGIKKMETVYYP